MVDPQIELRERRDPVEPTRGDRHLLCDSKLCLVVAPTVEWAALAAECRRSVAQRDGAEQPDNPTESVAALGGDAKDAATIIRENRDALAAEWTKVMTAYPPPMDAHGRPDPDDPLTGLSLGEYVIERLNINARGRARLRGAVQHVCSLDVLALVKEHGTSEQFHALCALVYLDHFARINGGDIRSARRLIAEHLEWANLKEGRTA